MEYIDYETYKSMGGTMEEDSFNKYEKFAEGLFDAWTLNRMRSERVVSDLEQLGLMDKVSQAMFVIIESANGIQAARQSVAKGSVVSSFSNGENSFSFVTQSQGGAANAAELETYRQVVSILPVELCSTCTQYNDAQ